MRKGKKTKGLKVADKLYLDGGSDTYIYESSAGEVRIKTPKPEDNPNYYTLTCPDCKKYIDILLPPTIRNAQPAEKKAGRLALTREQVCNECLKGSQSTTSGRTLSSFLL